MTHFELYNIPPSLSPDPSLVKKRFYELSRKYHPDFHGQASEEEQAAILETASQVNRAFKVFGNADETIKYVLQLKGLLTEEEKYQLSPDFLMEVMELNEQLMEVEDEQGKTAVQDRINQLKNEVYEPVAKIVENYQEGITTEEELLQVKEYYYRKKYLDRIAGELR